MNVARSLLIVAELTTDRFARMWAEFQETQIRHFLVVFLERRISEYHILLESCKQDTVQKVQGQLAEARALKTLLEQANVKSETINVTSYMK